MSGRLMTISPPTTDIREMQNQAINAAKGCRLSVSSPEKLEVQGYSHAIGLGYFISSL